MANLPPGCAQVLGAVLPFTATAGSLLIGIVIGGAAGWVIKPSSNPISYRATALTQVMDVCEPLIEELQNQLTTVTGQLEVVTAQVALTESTIADLEPKALAQGAAPSAVDGRSYVAELDAARTQRDAFEHELRMLRRLREGLLDQLTRTRERTLVPDAELAEEVAISDLLRDADGHLVDEGMISVWFEVVTETRREICGTGTGRRSADCRAAVHRELAAAKEAFVHCMRAGAPIPDAVRLEPGDERPDFARPLDPSNDLISGWTLTLCDPAPPPKPTTVATSAEAGSAPSP